MLCRRVKSGGKKLGRERKEKREKESERERERGEREREREREERGINNVKYDILMAEAFCL